MSWEKEDPRMTHPYAAGRMEGLGKRVSDPNSHRSRFRISFSRLSRTISGSTGLDRFSTLSPTLSDNESAYAHPLRLLASSSIATTTATGSPISASELPNLPVTPTPTRRTLSSEFSISSSYTYNSGTDYSHSNSSASGSVDGNAAGSCSKYSNVSEILATASTAAAVGGSPTATSSVIENSRRASLSSTIRKFWLEATGSDSSLAQSRTSLASSARSNRHSAHLDSEMRVSDWQLPVIDEPLDGMLEEEGGGGGRRGEERGPECMGESEEDLLRVERNAGHLSQHVRTASRDRLRIPHLHPLQTKFSFNSLSTVESVALAGTWDRPSATSLTPITIFSCKDDGLSDYKEDSPASEMMCVEEPVNQAIILHKDQADYGRPSPTDPLNKLGKELAIVDQLLGYLDFSEVIQLQQVCKYWKDVLRSREIYHTFIRQNYRYVVPGPGDMRVARTFADLQRIEKQNRAIKEGHLMYLTQIELKGLSPRVYYHSGYACYGQADTMEGRGLSNHQIILYNFNGRKRGEPETHLYPSSPGSKIMFTMLGGGACSGIHLAYGEINPDSSTSVSCYLVPSREAKWRSSLPPTIVLDENDRAIAQTNALVTVVAAKNRIVAWGQYGNLIGDTELPPEQANIQNKKAGNIFLSRDKIYLVTWSSQAPAWVSIYSNRTLECLDNYQLGSGSATYVSGSVTDNKLYLAVASPKDQDSSGLYSTWQLLCVDDSSLGVPQPIPDFPTFDHVAHVRFVYYPHHGRTYMTSHTDPSAGHWDPSYILTVVNNSSGTSTCVKKQTGYPTRFWLDGDVPHWDSLQGDNEFMIWCTRGAMKVFRFKT